MNLLYLNLPKSFQKHKTLEKHSYKTLFQKHSNHVERNFLDVQLESQGMKMFWKNA